MDAPECLTCHTDDYLRYWDYVPPTERVISNGRFRRTVPQAAEVTWTCTNCGRSDGRSLPDGWEVPSPNPKVMPEHPAVS